MKPGAVTPVALVASAVLIGFPRAGAAQRPPSTVAVRLRVETAGAVLPETRVTATARSAPRPPAAPDSGAVLAGTTGPDGGVVLRLHPASWLITATRIGFRPATVPLTLTPEDGDTTLTITLEPLVATLEEVSVYSTRVGRPLRRIEDQAVRVEVLGRDEVEEKLLMTPGDISMLLNETGGVRVQTTAPSLGGATVRIHGLRGRYTVLLADGLPLYGQASGLGLLQIPPMDLGQLEIIKGAASALYGTAALGGVVNLISRRPGSSFRREVLLNATTLGGADAVGYAEGPGPGRWRFSMLAGAHTQRRIDRDGDGWTDVPGYRRVVVRPRLYRAGASGATLLLTTGLTAETREGGTLKGAVAPDGAPFAEGLETIRVDAGGLGTRPVGARGTLTVRGSAMTQGHDLQFGAAVEPDRHTTWLGEGSLSWTWSGAAVVSGLAVQGDHYRHRELPGFDYDFIVTGVFAHVDLAPSDRVSAALSARLDHHSRFGTHFDPRASALLALGRSWRLRATAGTGFFAPTPFTETTEVVGLTALEPLSGLRTEEARSASLDLGGAAGPVELNATIFGSLIDHAVREVPVSPQHLRLVNLPGTTRTGGVEALARHRRPIAHGQLALTVSYTWLTATEPLPDGSGRRDVPLTPRHSVGLVGVWEADDAGSDGERGWRGGLEVYLTGRQPLDDDPYRDRSRTYLVLGLLAERRLGVTRVFLNAENLLGVRQTRYAPLVRPERGPDGRWTTDAWAPLEGRVLNGGLRLAW